MSFFSLKSRRPLLLPLVPLYAVGLALKAALRAKPRRLQRPVISVGSLSAGGTGKTPMTLLLIELLQRYGSSPVVLSRGYKREGSDVERVDPAGDAIRFGDEPMLLAQRGDVPVYVGDDRYAAGRMAEKSADAQTVFVLDDGFQHRGLARDVEIVLLTKRDVDDALLPAGDLREPLAALRRADVIVLRENEAAAIESRLTKWTDPARPPAVWMVRRTLSFNGEIPTQPLAFCGIARPKEFLTMLREAGCRPVARVLFRDHHAYGDRDLHRLISRAQRAEADAFVTTEKDAVRLNAEMRGRLEYFFPTAVARLEMDLVDEQAAMEDLLARLKRTGA